MPRAGKKAKLLLGVQFGTDWKSNNLNTSVLMVLRNQYMYDLTLHQLDHRVPRHLIKQDSGCVCGRLSGKY